MNSFASAALVSALLIIMGTIALTTGVRIMAQNKSSRPGNLMFFACVSVFLWDVGYAVMGLSFNDDFAYAARAVSLLSVCAYVTFVLYYLNLISGFSLKITSVVAVINVVGYFVAWLFIIRKDAVEFQMTPWGYWYTGAFSWARVLQFLTTIIVVILFYIVLFWWKKKEGGRRKVMKEIIGQFYWFGPVLILGYTVDTVLPIFAHIPAVPGSAVGAFVSVMILISISNKYRTFGVTMSNVSTYVYNEVNTSVFVLDDENKIVLFNHMASEMFGEGKRDLKGLTMEDILDPLEISSDMVRKFQSKIFRVKDKEVFCSFDKTEIMNKYGELQFTIIFTSDMTSEVAAIRMLNESIREAQEASAAKSNFLANMSHEIRTPMNAIVGMSDILLRDEKLSPDVVSQLQNIKDAGDSLLGIINDILDFSKIEAGKYELIEDTYEIPSLIHEVSTVINVKLQEKNVQLKVTVDQNVPIKVIGDELRVRQILMNILGNALKFTQKGFIELSVRSERINEFEQKLMFDIRDTGIGIKKENLAAIFGEFTQVDTRKNRNAQGTGLGLAISKELAMMMNGDITVDSVYGEGSVFHVVIVQEYAGDKKVGLAGADALAKLEYQHARNKDEFVIKPRPDKKVLIVDDTKMNLVVAKGLMKPYSLQLDTAVCGKEAIEKVIANDYDLVFMDHMMPEMDGVDTVHAIRALDGEKYKNLTIVALSANAIAGTKEMMIKEGMQDYLAKPIDRNELNAIIEKYLPV
ncbi:MAG: response regulator [Lachnospiraceae bacterium]|nr:response regulator [Candidatus Merdinaster equi]